MDSLADRIPPCRPPLWARGGHAQTLLGHLLPSRAPRIAPAGGYERREVPLPDGDRLVAFTRPGRSGVRVLLLHGLSGDTDADYMRRSAAALTRAGHGVWAVNHRGCGAGRGLARRPYHSGKTEDLQAVLAASVADAPELSHLVVGFSLSANLALLYAARGLAPAAAGIVAVNPPVDLLSTTLAIGRGFSRLYERRFLWRLRRAVRERQRRGLTERSVVIPRGTRLLEFDDLFTAPECGFASGRDYYERCSSLPLLGAVRVPSVLLTAADDPFVDASVLDPARLSPTIHLHVEPHGGHLGYLARRGLLWRRWLDAALVHYVAHLARRATRETVTA